MVSGMTVNSRTSPNTSLFSAVAPTAADPIAISAQAAAKAVVEIAIAAAIDFIPICDALMASTLIPTAVTFATISDIL